MQYIFVLLWMAKLGLHGYTYCLRTKDEIHVAWMEWCAVQENWTGLNVRILFSDNEPSLLQAEFQGYLVGKGIQPFTTQAYSSEMNGPAENAIKHLVQHASAMMHTAKIPEGFWPEAVRVSAYLKNHSPHKAIRMTPYEAWFDQRPDLGHLRIFGCRYYGHVEKKNWTKWESHTAKGILMGYYVHEGLYAIYDINKRVIIKKRDVTFFENVMGHPSMDGFGLAPGYDILGEPIVEVEQIPQILEEEDNWDNVKELMIGDLKSSTDEVLAMTIANLIGDLKPSADEILAMTIANLHITGEEEYDYVPVDTMVSTVSMSFVHQALREWQQERKKQRKDEVPGVEKSYEIKVEEMIKRWQYNQLAVSKATMCYNLDGGGAEYIAFQLPQNSRYGSG